MDHHPKLSESSDDGDASDNSIDHPPSFNVSALRHNTATWELNQYQQEEEIEIRISTQLCVYEDRGEIHELIRSDTVLQKNRLETGDLQRVKEQHKTSMKNKSFYVLF
ncbi:hypothetical protein cypCar_00048222 [Cyprinus carpio]|nr:hypothetical protein cypCar_00048222 [Cyprinus carpio]